MNKLIKTVILSLGIITLNTGQAQDVDLPDLGTQGGAIITPAEEYRTGATVVRNLRHAGLIVDDPLLTDYLNHLGYQLLSQHDYDAHNQFQFFLVNDNSLNAFALPGGFIGINYGLFSQTESESELASVVAHEIAHVTQRHYARAYDVGAQSSSLPVLAAIIAAIVLGSQSGQGGEIGEAALATAAAVSVREKINFTRQNEKEADRIGIQILSEAGFNPEDMASFFDKIERESRLHGINVPEFLRTHPVSASRISDARDRARQLPKNKSQATLDYQIMRHRILALSSSDKKSNLKTYQEALKTKTGEELVATQYGYVLSLTRLEKYQTAYQQIEVLLKEYPHKIAFLLAKAEIQFKDQNPSAAIRTYQHALQTYPGNESILHDYIDVLIKQKKYKQANKELEIFLKTQPQNPVFYKYLAETKAALNLTAESHEALAEYYYQRGQFHQAIDQINIALKAINNDFYTASKLEAKLRHIKEEIPPTTN